MRRCARCLYPDTKPDLHFDSNGVCSACRAYDLRKEVDWASRKGELVRVLDGAKRVNGYDCIVPSSGGKDSHWQVLKLIELGARPLIVTATTCHLTDVGRRNIDNLSRYATTLEVSPNKTVRAKLNKIGLTLLGDISWPEHVGIFTIPFRVACSTGINLIFYGECPQNQYGGPPGTEKVSEMTLQWVQEFGGLLGFRPSDAVGMGIITFDDMADYTLPSVEVVRRLGIKAYFMGWFHPWDSHENAGVARKYGMEQCRPSLTNWWGHENLDNAQTGLHDHMMFLKHGYGRAAAQLSVDIRGGKIDRSQALAIALECESKYPADYMGITTEEILGRINVTRAEYDSVCERFRNKKLAC